MIAFGHRDEFAIVLAPLSGPPEEADPSAAATWASLQVWVRGRNLFEHSHAQSGSVHSGLNWPAIYLSRWLVRNWKSFFCKQSWPIEGHMRNARDVADALDHYLVELEDESGEDETDRFLELRDDFVMSHCLTSPPLLTCGVRRGVHGKGKGPPLLTCGVRRGVWGQVRSHNRLWRHATAQ